MEYPLLTNRLSIEPLSARDIEAFLRYRQDPDIARFQSWDPDYTRSEAEALIQSQAGVIFPTEGEWLQLAIHSLETGALVGDLALHALDADLEFELGFTIAKENQLKGFAKEAAARLSAHLFEQVGAKKIVTTPDARNFASIGLLAELGFSRNLARGWTEHFKGEFVTVEFFELEQRPETSKMRTELYFNSNDQ